MADYLKVFATQADYDAYIAGGYPKPNVSYIEATDETIFTNYADSEGPDTVLESVKIADFTGTTFQPAKIYVKSAVIPEGVTTLAYEAFYTYTLMTSVTLPSSLTSIGDSAFDGCTSLASIEFPSSLSVIGEVAFRNCPFTSVDIPATITNIKRYAFNNCRSLTSVTVRATTPPTLGESAFYGTPANMVIYVPAESVETYKAANNWSTYASQIQAIP